MRRRLQRARNLQPAAAATAIGTQGSKPRWADISGAFT